MSGNTSSAEPQTLLDYCRLLAPLDQRVVASSASLAGDLASFESSCTEYPVHVGYLADTMATHGRRAGGIDEGVKTVGDRFLWADEGSMFPRLPVPPGNEVLDRDWLERLVEAWDTIKPLAGGLLIALFTHAGRVPGTIVIDLPDALRHLVSLREVRTWAGLSGHLNTIGVANLPGHIARFALWASIPVIAWQWFQDFQHYTGTMLAGAMTVDAALTLIPIGLGYLAGVGIAALAGAAAAAAGVAAAPAVLVGGAIVLTGIGIGLAFNWAVERYGLRDRAIGVVDQGLRWVGEQHGRSAAWVDENILQPVSDQIQQSWARLHSWVDGAAAVLMARFQAVLESLGAVLGGGVLIPSPAPTPPPALPEAPPAPAVPEAPPAPAAPTFTNLRERIEEREVETNPNYTPFQPEPDDTYCNIFAMNIANDLGAPLPEYLKWTTAEDPDRYLDANLMTRWLGGALQTTSAHDGSAYTGSQGPAAGWRLVTDQAEAARLAQQGSLVLVGWDSATSSDSVRRAGPGHMAVMRPDSTPGNVLVAQAGGTNHESVGIGNAFPAGETLQYYVFGGTADPALVIKSQGRRMPTLACTLCTT